MLEHLSRQAYLANYWTSFSPEIRGQQMIKEYSNQLESDILELQNNNIASEIIADYQKRYESLFSSWLSAKSRCASSMITGPANFNVRRHQKANRSEENHYSVFQVWREKAKKAIIRKSQPAKTFLTELDRYKQELESLKRNHEQMKEGNKIIAKARKEGKDISDYLINTFGVAPHMIDWAMKFGFGLQNNNANIKRVEERIKEIEAKEQMRDQSPVTNYSFEGGKMVINYEADRIQIFFDNRPTREELTTWKSNGLNSFNWSPSNNSWQRKITANAMSAVKRMLPPLTKM
jgi:hypothetical protein